METSLCTLADAVDVLDAMFPPDTALGGDVVGLTVGDPSAPVRSVLLAVDPTLAVVDEAVAGGHDLMVTHHHLLRSGLHAVLPSEPKGAAVLALAGGGVGLYSAHTNADVARGGVNEPWHPRWACSTWSLCPCPRASPWAGWGSSLRR